MSSDSKWQDAFQLPRAFFVLAIFVACYFFLIFPISSYSKDAMITDILVTNDASHVTVYARVTNCFTKKMESAIQAGVPTTFTFLLELYQDGERWFDKKIAGVVVKQTIKYDNVKKLFFVSSTGAPQPSEFQDFEMAKKAMAELNGTVVAPISDLQKNSSYYMKIKAKLDEVRLPLHMEYVLFFVSLWDFETDWYRQQLVISSW